MSDSSRFFSLAPQAIEPAQATQTVQMDLKLQKKMQMDFTRIFHESVDVFTPFQ
jgi:hypothetical protein